MAGARSDAVISDGMTAVRIFAPAVSLAYGVGGVVQLVGGSATTGGVLVGVFLILASLLTLAMTVRSRRPGSAQHASARLTVLIGVGLASTLLVLAQGQPIEDTAFLMLALVSAGALCVRWAQLLALVGLGCLGWLIEVLLLGIARETVTQYALQLLCAALLGVVVFWIRSHDHRAIADGSARLAAKNDELERSRDEQQEASARYRTLFNNGPLAISLTDENGLFAEVNNAVEELFGASREQILGRSPLDFTHPDDVGHNMMVAQRIEEAPDGVARFEQRLVRVDGQVRWALISVTWAAGPENQRWALAHLQDITMRKQMELDLIRSRDGLKAAADIATATQRGVDPRPVAMSYLQRLARASSVIIVEPVDAQTLMITASTNQDLLGARMDLSEPSGTAHVWGSGQPLFLAEARDSPLTSTRLVNQAGAMSAMWQPVGIAGRLDAVLALTWNETMGAVDQFERDTVGAIAAELSSALIAEKMRSQLEERTRVDALTGILNRRGWDHEVASMLDHSRRSGRPFVLAVADLDHFKQFNDEFGHLEGDILLAGFAREARAAMREVDVLARWGGEEFSIALRDCDMSDAQNVLERVRQSVPAGRTCSIGYATIHPDETLTQCMQRVDDALYRAKETGRNRIEYAAPMAPAPTTEGSVRAHGRARR